MPCIDALWLKYFAPPFIKRFNCLWDAPDTQAGAAEQEREAAIHKELHLKMPPNKRPNFVKLGVASPFSCPWKTLLADWSEGGSEPNVSVRRRGQTAAKPFHEWKEHGTSGCDLLPVKVQVLGKGTFTDNSMICWPSDSDIHLLLASINNKEVRSYLKHTSLFKPYKKRHLKGCFRSSSRRLVIDTSNSLLKKARSAATS